jgi:hypothetical protein
VNSNFNDGIIYIESFVELDFHCFSRIYSGYRIITTHYIALYAVGSFILKNPRINLDMVL